MMKTFNKNQTYCTALRIVKTLQEHGYSAYFAGGAVRDMLLEKTADDIDIATSAKPEEVIRLFPHSYKIGAAFGIINIIENGKSFEVATFRKERNYCDGRHPEEVYFSDNPETDAKRRDFTINGMFFDPVSEKLLDFVDGKKDLASGILRTIGNAEERFSEDYLRILRAVRFCTRFKLQFTEDIPPAIKKTKGNLQLLSAERIRDELNKMFTGPEPDRAIRLLFDLEVLKEILPEVADMHGITQPPEFHPEGDALTHTLLMFTHMTYPSVELAWAILLHDVGKPVTQTIGDDGIEHFYRHDQKSADIAEKILSRLRFPKKTIDAVVHAVRNHMRFAHVHEMRASKWKRIIAEATFPLELELHRIDCISSHRKLNNYILLLDRIYEQENSIQLPKPLITGKDLLELGFKPGPEIGKLLKQVADMQLEEKLKSKEDALDWIQSHSSN